MKKQVLMLLLAASTIFTVSCGMNQRAKEMNEAAKSLDSLSKSLDSLGKEL